jgi:hypothetical protein
MDLLAECVLTILKEIPVADVVSVGCSCSGAASHLHGQEHTHYLLSTMHCLLLACSAALAALRSRLPLAASNDISSSQGYCGACVRSAASASG